MLLWNFVKIKCTSCLQDLEMKQNHLFIMSAQLKISINDSGKGKQSDPYKPVYLTVSLFYGRGGECRGNSVNKFKPDIGNNTFSSPIIHPAKSKLTKHGG